MSQKKRTVTKSMSIEEVGGISKERIRRFESRKIEKGRKGRKKTKNDKKSITCDDEVLVREKQETARDDEEEQPKNHKRRFVCLLEVGLCGFVAMAVEGRGRSRFRQSSTTVLAVFEVIVQAVKERGRFTDVDTATMGLKDDKPWVTHTKSKICITKEKLKREDQEKKVMKVK